MTQEEKIDYIYDTLRKNDRKAALGTLCKWTYRLIILWYLYYFFFISLPGIVDKIPGFWWWEDVGSMTKILENPEIQKFLENYRN